MKLRVWNVKFSNAYKLLVTAHYFDFVSVNTEKSVTKIFQHSETINVCVAILLF